MTLYDDTAQLVGAEPIRLVEIDLDSCANAYGVLPCEAELGVSGADRCYNSFQTCQDKANFAQSTKTLRFWPKNRRMVKGQQALPFLEEADIAPTTIDPEHGLGPRGTVEISFIDPVDDDALTDPYAKLRAYDRSQGSFFGKLKARNGQSLLGRPVRVLEGFVLDPWDEAVFQTHTYFIEDFAGPDDSGRFRLKASDPLGRGDHVLYPPQADAPLTADMDVAATSLNVRDKRGTITEATGVVRIGDEVMDYASRTVEADGTLTLGGLTRATWGTTAEDHKAGDNCQQCVAFIKQKVVPILTALHTAAGNAAYINTTGWQTEQDNWFAARTFTHLLSKPEKVSKHWKDLCQQATVFQWWNELSQQIELAAIAPTTGNTQPPLLSDGDVILANSFRYDEGLRGQVTRVIVHYGPADRTELSDFKNYRSTFVRINADAEAAEAYGRIRPLEIYAPWVESSTAALVLAVRKAARVGTGDGRATFEIDVKDKAIALAGALVRVEHPSQQDATGAPKQMVMRVLSARVRPGGKLLITATPSTYQTGIDPTERVWIWQDQSAAGVAYGDATPAQLERSFWADTDGLVAPGVPGDRWF